MICHWQRDEYGETAVFSVTFLKNVGNYVHKSSVKITLLAKSSTLITLLNTVLSV